MKPWGIGCWILLLLSACAAPTPTLAVELRPTPETCTLAPLMAPTKPAAVPAYTELDETTGLHVTGFPPEIDLSDYRLHVTGKVIQPLELTLDQLRCLPKVTERPTLTCPGFFEDVATWSGTPLTGVLEMAGIQPDAKSILLISADGYQAFLALQDALRAENYLAYEWEGEALPVLHGFPLRAVIPAFPGAKWTKWLVEVRVE